jgi:hypothetical protein
MKKQLLIAAAFTVICPFAGNVQAQQSGLMDDVHGTIGLRLWRTEWTSWFGSNQSYLAAGDETAVIPVASIRYKEFLVSGSYMAKTDFSFTPAYTPERKEYDINFGYFLLPSLAATVGYKHMHYDSPDGYDWTTKGWTVGLSGSAPLAPYMSIYGNLAYGRPKIQDNSLTFTGQRARYLLTEFGLAFPLGHFSPSMSGFLVTAGYRYQKVGADPNAAGGVGTRELFEYTQGPVLGLSYSMYDPGGGRKARRLTASPPCGSGGRDTCRSRP